MSTIISLTFLTFLHTGGKVEFNTVDFIESRPFCFGSLHTGDKVGIIVLATKLNVYGNSRLYCRFWQQLTFNKVDCVEFNFVASVYRDLYAKKLLSTYDYCGRGLFLSHNDMNVAM